MIQRTTKRLGLRDAELTQETAQLATRGIENRNSACDVQCLTRRPGNQG